MLIGIDLGGTKIAGGLVKDGKVIKRIIAPTGADKGRKHVLAQLRMIIGALSEGQRIKGVGIGVPGTFRGTRIVEMANIPCLKGVDFRTLTKAKLVVTNDARCFALAEHRFGAGKGTKHMIGITLGTGVGTGIIIDGKVYAGAGDAGDGGHTIHNLMLESYAFGSGDWEEVISGRGMVLRHKARGGKEDHPKSIWFSKSRAAAQTREETLRLTTIFIANLCRTLDPEIVVLGGGISNLPLTVEINKRLPRYKARPVVKRSVLGLDAAIIGATVPLQ
jgi:glucokinase